MPLADPYLPLHHQPKKNMPMVKKSNMNSSINIENFLKNRSPKAPVLFHLSTRPDQSFRAPSNAL